LKNYLKPDSRWEIFGQKSHEAYLEHIFKDFWLTPKAPEGIQEAFAVAEHILALSYFNYVMFDDGVFKLARIFEMMLRMKFEELPSDEKDEVINIFKKKNQMLLKSRVHSAKVIDSIDTVPTKNKKPQDPSLDQLIAYYCKNGYFDSPEEVLKNIKDIRNHWAHPHQHTFAGSSLMHWMIIINDLINEFYEDRDLRKKRIRLLEEVKKSSYAFKDKLSILEYLGQSIPSCGAMPVFINNKITPNSCSLVVIPLIDLEPYFNDQHPIPEIFKFEIIDLKISDTVISGTDLYTFSEVKVIINEDPIFEVIYKH
jgi:hypothetical protein